MGHGRSIVTLLVAFALMGVFSLLGQGTRVQQPTYKVSGKLVGGPPVLASRFGPTVIFSLQLRPPRRDDDGPMPKPLVWRGTLNTNGSDISARSTTTARFVKSYSSPSALATTPGTNACRLYDAMEMKSATAPYKPTIAHQNTSEERRTPPAPNVMFSDK